MLLLFQSTFVQPTGNTNVVIVDLPQLELVDSETPMFLSIDRTQAILQETTTTYNSTNTTYSSSSQVYGGVDRNNFPSPFMLEVESYAGRLSEVEDMVPVFAGIDYTVAALQTTDTTYNSSSTQYSSSSQVYGGVDRNNFPGPSGLEII